jgi:hypothetical protein
MKYLKGFNEAFGRNGMFDWKVADMKHTPSSIKQLGLDKKDEVCKECDCKPCQCTTEDCIIVNGKKVKDFNKNGDASFNVEFEDGTETIIYVSHDDWDKLNDSMLKEDLDLGSHFREVRVNSYLKIARDKYKGKTADEIIDIIDRGNPELRFVNDEERELFKQEWEKENKKGTFSYFMSLSNEELKDYQKNFSHHGFENPAEHNPDFVAWKKACQIKKVFVEPKEDNRNVKSNKIY